MTLQPSIAFDTIELVGREREKKIIQDALSASNGSQAVFLRGHGGVGKTRLLRWAVDAAQQQGILTSGIVDLYHSATHSNSGIECAILLGSSHVECAPRQRHQGRVTPAGSGIDPLKESFQRYWKLQGELQSGLEHGSESERLEELRADIARTFVAEYNALAETRRILLAFDTAELIQYESDIIQQISRPTEVATEVKAWIATILPQLRNTVILLAGRGPRSERDNARIRLWEDLQDALGAVHLQVPDLVAFTPEETDQYFDAVASMTKAQAARVGMAAEEKNVLVRAAVEIEKVGDDDRKRAHQITGGFPIRLGLMIDLLLFGDWDFIEKFSVGDPDLAWADVRDNVVDQLRRTNVDASPSEMLEYLACTRMGLTPELLQNLMSSPTFVPDLGYCRHRLESIARLSFVKKHEGTEAVFLHDEVYGMLEECLIRRAPGVFRKYYTRIAEFIEDSKDLLLLPDDAQLAILHYQLRQDPGLGYQTYVKLDERAIKGHDSEQDFRLRDEVLRFLDDPYNENLASNYGWPRSKIDQDCAVRWVKRHVARHDNQRAVDVAETVLALGPKPYRSLRAEAEQRRQEISAGMLEEAERGFNTDDPFFWGHLLTYYGEALLYLNDPGKPAEEVLNRVIDLLGRDVDAIEEGFQGWLRARILGRVYNNRGYLKKVHGQYGQALVEYRRALPYFVRAGIPDEQANTLNNLAFLLGLLGRTDSALTQSERAMRLRRSVGQRYPLALSYNTRGYIYTWDDHPMWGQRDCGEARKICEELKETRGLGLAYIGLGFASRKRGDQWKAERYSFSEAEDYFEKSEDWLTQAERVFGKQVTEPIRLWEAKNELGSLYCDWAFLAMSRNDSEREHDCYRKSEQHQRDALAIARQHGLAFQEADSRDDLAQVLADQGRFREAEEEIAYIERELIPDSYKLKDGAGFDQELEGGETALLSLGKIYLQRGIWAFQAAKDSQTLAEAREAKLREGVRHFALSAAYLQQFWLASDSLRKTLRSFSRRLAEFRVPAYLAREAVQEVEKTYGVDLRGLLGMIDDTLGI